MSAGKIVFAENYIESRTDAPATLSDDIGSDELRAYCRKVEALHEKVPLMGFKTALRVPIRVEDLYVSLRAMIDERLTGKAVFADAEDAERSLERCRGGCEISVPDAFKAAQERNRRGLVILGDPGAGKTTHLKRVLLWCLHGGLDDLGLPQDVIPVFLPLRELKDVSKSLDDFIQDQLDQPHLGTPPGFGKGLLERGHLVFLLDGLDEVADTGHRAHVSRWIERAMTVHPSCWFVVTCRFAGYTDQARLSADFLEMHLRPLTAEQAEGFVRNWYRIVQGAQTADSEQALILATEKADELIERLRQPDFRTRRVFELTRNPLLLTNICLVHLSRGNLPHTRAALYEECVEVLLERWRSAAGIATRITAQSGRTVLQPVAYWLHQQEERTRATAEELAPVIAPALKAIGGGFSSAQDFLQAVRDESGILTGWDQRHYGFMHLGFQEYLTAVELRNKAFDDPAIWQELAAQFGEPWWQEVILLLLALYNPSVFQPFMREVLKRPGIESQRSLIDMCLDDAAEASAQPFVELLGIDAGDDAELWPRQFMALQIVARIDPQALEALTSVLLRHPSPQIRQWLREQDAQARQQVIYAERGGYELVFVPGGSFLMGSPEDEDGRSGDESPVHEVTVPDFYMGRYPVTNEEYGRFLAEHPDAEEPAYWGNRDLNQPRQPVVGVSWHEAERYAAWAGLRLPSEAEWEYACRAGTSSRYYTGDSDADLDRAGWYVGNSGGTLHPVGEKEPNAFGLYDMHGNVYEWCQDLWHDDYTDAPTDGSAWESGSGSGRVLRGGGWGFGAANCRSAVRYFDDPGNRYDYVGFRLLRT